MWKLSKEEIEPEYGAGQLALFLLYIRVTAVCWPLANFLHPSRIHLIWGTLVLCLLISTKKIGKELEGEGKCWQIAAEISIIVAALASLHRSNPWEAIRLDWGDKILLLALFLHGISYLPLKEQLKIIDLESDFLDLNLHLLLTVWPWTIYLTALCFIFLAYKIEIIIISIS